MASFNIMKALSGPRVPEHIKARLDLTDEQLVVKAKNGGTAYLFPHQKTLSLFAQNTAALANAVRSEQIKGVNVFPDHVSTDEDYFIVKDRIQRSLSEAFDVTVDDYGRVHSDGVLNNFGGLRYVPGIPMTPATYTPLSNKRRRKDAGLVEEPTYKWHENVFRAWWRWAIRGASPVALPVKKSSSSCFPDFERSNTSAKFNIVRRALSNAEEAGKMMIDGDYATPWIKFQIGGAVYIVYRLQASDKVTFDPTKPPQEAWTAKERKVMSLLYAISNGEEGEIIVADKSKYVQDYMDEHNFSIPGFFACRKRTAAGGPLAMNAIVGPMADAIRANIYRKGGKTYHDRTRDQKTKDIREFDFQICSDVSDHDLLFMEYHLTVACEEMEKLGVEPWFLAILKRAMTLPQYVSSLSTDDGNLLIGEIDQENPVGMLLSGIKWTDIFGTGGMSPIYIIMQIENCFQEAISVFENGDEDEMNNWMDAYMNHKLPIAMKSKSDDAILLFRGPTVTSKAKVLLENLKAVADGESDFVASKYMIVGFEPSGYLGDILLFDDSRDLKKARFIGNISSFVVNKFNPEYSCPPRGTDIKDYPRYKRKFPGLAWKSATQVYGDSPIFGKVLRIIDTHWMEVYGRTFTGYMDELEKEDERNLIRYLKHFSDVSTIKDQLSENNISYTPIDLEVLADESKIHYKFQPEQISKHILDIIQTAIPVEEVETYFRTFWSNYDEYRIPEISSH